MTLTKSVLAATLAGQLGINEREAKDLVEGFYEEICLSLEGGEAVNLVGFGNFLLEEGVVAFEPNAALTKAAP